MNFSAATGAYRTIVSLSLHLLDDEIMTSYSGCNEYVQWEADLVRQQCKAYVTDGGCVWGDYTFHPLASLWDVGI